MTSAVRAPASRTAEEDITDTHPSDPRAVRWLFRVATLLTVLPIAVAAVRHGLDGWVPVGDAATTAIRAHDVFTRNVPLVGMWSSASNWAGRPINFPGALQLYVMAVPIRLLGPTWGVLIGIATINVTAVLTACWLIRRRVGYRMATLACVFLASFVWTLGSEVLVDMTPMQMITVPAMLLFVAAWAVADGDLPALPIFFFTANYLFLDHLTLAALVPVLALSAVTLLGLDARRRRRTDPDAWPRHRRALWRYSGLSLAITALAWVPPLFQQFFTSPPHNLTNLYEASKVTPPKVVAWKPALSVVGATVAAPPFWLRPTFYKPSFQVDGTGQSALVVIAFTVFLLVAYGASLVIARRRQARTLVNGLLIALASVLGAILTTKKSSNPIGLMAGYLHSIWVSAVFVWMMLVIAAVQLLPRPRTPTAARIVQPMAVAAVALFAVLALPTSDQGSGTWPWAVAPAKEINAQVIPQLHGRGTVLVTTGGSLEEGAMAASLLFAMQDKGIPFVFQDEINRYQFGARRTYTPATPNAQVGLQISSRPDATAGSDFRLIARVSAKAQLSSAELSRLDRAVASWAEQRGRPLVNPKLTAINPELAAEVQAKLDRAYADARSTGEPLTDNPTFIDSALGTPTMTYGGSWLLTTGMEPDDLRRWATERHEASQRTFYIYLGPISP